jgi:hypothetical protein
VSLASQPSPIVLKKDDAEKDDEVEAVHVEGDVAARAPLASTAGMEVSAGCTEPLLTGACGPVR